MQRKNSDVENIEELANLLPKTGLTPKQLHKKLDEYVIGQDEAKKTLCVGMYNHWKRVLMNRMGLTVGDERLKDVKIEKSNILLLGNTGTGKTYLIKTIAKMLGFPCYIGDATRLTSAGYVGDDIETVITGLLQECNYDIQTAEMGIICIDEADKLSRKGDNPSITRDVGGECVQQGILKIVEGGVVGVPPFGGRKHPEQPLLYVDTTDILFIFMGAFEGLDKIITRRCNIRRIGFNEHPTLDNKENIIDNVTPEDLKKYGFIPERQFPIIAMTQDLTKGDLVRILKEPKNALIKQYQKLLAIDNISLTFSEQSLERIAESALETKTGARGLRRIMEQVLNNIMYDFSDFKDKTVNIDTEYVDRILGNKEKPLNNNHRKARISAIILRVMYSGFILNIIKTHKKFYGQYWQESQTIDDYTKIPPLFYK